jgi:hypothetical protein
MAVLVPVLLAGCASSDKPGAEKARYITQSDGICTDVFAKASAAGSGHDQATAQKLADVWQDGANRLRAIPEPKESVEQARQFTTSVENLSLGYTAAANALGVNDQARADKSFREVDQIKKDAADTAKEYGYKECRRING